MKHFKLNSLRMITILLLFVAACTSISSDSGVNISYLTASAYEIAEQDTISNNSPANVEDEEDYDPGEPPVKPSLKLSKAEAESEKVVFLTIDDGPSVITPGFLDVLKRENVRATFCVIGNRAESYPDIIKRAYNVGHSIISHSHTHVFSQIYSSPQAFIASIERSNATIDSIVERNDTEKSFLRFPGGASWSYVPIARLLKIKGYNTIDWNVSSRDCDTGKATAQYILKYSTQDKGQDMVVLLMHDFRYRQSTLAALPDIIKYYKDRGYSFRTIRDMSVIDLQRLKDRGIVNVLY